MIDFRTFNASLDTITVIRELRLETNSLGGGQWRGRCPFHHSENPRSRSLAISLPLRKFMCHNAKCGAHGDLIDLWAYVRQLSLQDAAVEIMNLFNLEQEEER